MPKLKPGTIIPTPKEDAEINAQINADSDDFEWTEKIFREAKTFEKSDLPKSFKDEVRRGRPKVEKPKILLSVRYSSDVVEFFKASGKGWQTRMDEVLREYVASHR
jgi:uncharacterized protein (DUF4415 family)